MHSWLNFFVIPAMIEFIGAARAGYLIDRKSCSEAQTEFVRQTIESAFDMAQNAMDEVQSPQFSDSTKSLMRLLFNTHPNANGDDPTGQQIIQSAFESHDAPGRNDGQKRGILTYRGEKHDSDDLGRNDVIIYCDEKRLKPMKKDKDGNDYFDPVIGAAVKKPPEPCRELAFAYTIAVDPEGESSDPEKPDIIQICPWFTDYAMAKKYKTFKNIETFRGLFSIVGLDKVLTKFIYTPVDLFSLWDKVFLHEMMHTKAGDTLQDKEEIHSYGWKNCRRFAERGDAVENPDTFALFGSAITIIKKGGSVNDDGTIVEPPNQPAGRTAPQKRGQLGSPSNPIPGSQGGPHQIKRGARLPAVPWSS